MICIRIKQDDLVSALARLYKSSDDKRPSEIMWTIADGRICVSVHNYLTANEIGYYLIPAEMDQDIRISSVSGPLDLGFIEKLEPDYLKLYLNLETERIGVSDDLDSYTETNLHPVEWQDALKDESYETEPISIPTLVKILSAIVPPAVEYERKTQVWNRTYIYLNHKGVSIAAGNKSSFMSKTILLNNSPVQNSVVAVGIIQNWHTKQMLSFIKGTHGRLFDLQVSPAGNGVSIRISEKSLTVTAGDGYMSFPIISKDPVTMFLMSGDNPDNETIRVHGAIRLPVETMEVLKDIAKKAIKDNINTVIEIANADVINHITVNGIEIPVEVTGGQARLSFASQTLYTVLNRLTGSTVMYYKEFTMTPVNIVEVDCLTEACIIQIPT